MDKNYFSFDIKTGMKNIIGRDLITDDFIAIFELVKNSYDAYADYVTLTFNNDEIIISDNGKGMSETDLKEKWFAVGYSAKNDGTEDSGIKRGAYLNNLKSRRFYAGEKGIGRFSCDRLGNRLELISTDSYSKQTNKVFVDWEQFDIDSKQSFKDIKIPYERTSELYSYPSEKSHGTILKINRLHSEWTADKLKRLKHSLQKIINPFSNKSDFTIEIIAQNFLIDDEKEILYNQINGIINNTILQVLDLKTTQIEVKVDREKLTTKILDRGTLIYHIEEKNIYSHYIDDLDIGLYFLNRSAKINFGKIMDIEPVNYGNVFLFKNGFRIQPYGELGDDSWKIDGRKQQGYNRFLGTRELFGKVDLITESFNEFKEVSSRNGGLVDTMGKKILFELFDKALKRLERYVVGVLWGEAFKRKGYFVNESTADEYRDQLKGDQYKDSYEDIKDNVGSKIDFVNLVKSLSDEKDVKIIAYNKELVDLVNARLDIVQPKFILDLEKIAEKTNDLELLNQVKLTDENFKKLIKEKEDAVKRAEEEEIRRVEADRKAKEEETKRILIEIKLKEEEDRRRNAEIAKLKSEQILIDEKEAHLNTSLTLDLEKEKYKYLESTRHITSEAQDIMHTIEISSTELDASMQKILYVFNNSKNYIEIQNVVNSMRFHVDRIKKLTQLLNKADISSLKNSIKVDIPSYIREYLSNYSQSISSIQFNKLYKEPFIRKISLLDLSVILDNLVSNSKKAGAKKIFVDFKNLKGRLCVDFSDDGYGVDEDIIKNNALFQLGITNRVGGSGIGLSTIKSILNKELYGDIEFVGNGMYFEHGATFRLIF